VEAHDERAGPMDTAAKPTLPGRRGGRQEVVHGAAAAEVEEPDKGDETSPAAWRKTNKMKEMDELGSELCTAA
jgi:hypothetical protein